jgi:hypothetical protein
MIRRVVRWLAIAILVVLATVLLVFTTAPGGRLIALALNRLGSTAVQSVEIDRISGLLSGSTRIGHVLLSAGDRRPDHRGGGTGAVAARIGQPVGWPAIGAAGGVRHQAVYRS